MTNNLSAGKQSGSFSSGEDDKQMLHKRRGRRGMEDDEGLWICVWGRYEKERKQAGEKKVKTKWKKVKEEKKEGRAVCVQSDVQSSPCPWGPSSRRRTRDGSSRWRKARSIDRHTALHTLSLSLSRKWKGRVLKVWHTHTHTHIFTFIKWETIPPPSHKYVWHGIQTKTNQRLRQPKGRTRGVWTTRSLARTPRRTLKAWSATSTLPLSQQPLQRCPWASLLSSNRSGFSSVTSSLTLWLCLSAPRYKSEVSGGWSEHNRFPPPVISKVWK